MSTHNELYHHGILGMKWGVRRYQNADGSLTPEGRQHYYPGADPRGRSREIKYGRHDLKVANKREESILKKHLLSREEHYYRNNINRGLPKTPQAAIRAGWHTVIANAHQFTKAKGQGKNIKYVSPDGKKEVMFNASGKAINAPLDMGSYNYVPSGTSYYGHFKYDILPWIMYGNSAEDSSSAGQRVAAILGVYSKGMKDKGQAYVETSGGSHLSATLDDVDRALPKGKGKH